MRSEKRSDGKMDDAWNELSLQDSSWLLNLEKWLIPTEKPPRFSQWMLVVLNLRWFEETGSRIAICIR